MSKNVSINTEKSLLGGIIATSKNFFKYANFVNEEMFYDTTNKLIFKTFWEMTNLNPKEYVASPALIDALTKKDGKKNWHFVISELVVDACSEAMIVGYAKRLDDLKKFRTLEKTLETFASEIKESPNESLLDVVSNLEQKMFEVSKDAKNADFESVEELSEVAFSNIKRRLNHDELGGLQTGFATLDEITGGFQKSDLIILAARPSMGKTAFALNLAKNISKNKNVGFISLEMSSEQLIQRLFSTVSLVDLTAIKTPSFLKTIDWRKLNVGIEQVKKLHLYIDDTPGLLISEILWKVRKFARARNIDVLIIDYLQLINVKSNYNADRQLEVSTISRALKFLAKEINIPIIALSQLSRRVEQRENKKPMMSDLRESGAIEQDADIVMFLYREEYYTNRSFQGDETNVDDEVDYNAPQESELIIAKHRNGPIGSINLVFRPSIGLFSDLLKKDD